MIKKKDIVYKLMKNKLETLYIVVILVTNLGSRCIYSRFIG